MQQPLSALPSNVQRIYLTYDMDNPVTTWVFSRIESIYQDTLHMDVINGYTRTQLIDYKVREFVINLYDMRNLYINKPDIIPVFKECVDQCVELFRDKKNWTTNFPAKNISGYGVIPTSPQAVSWCATGAICRNIDPENESFAGLFNNILSYLSMAVVAYDMQLAPQSGFQLALTTLNDYIGFTEVQHLFTVAQKALTYMIDNPDSYPLVSEYRVTTDSIIIDESNYVETQDNFYQYLERLGLSTNHE